MIKMGQVYVVDQIYNLINWQDIVLFVSLYINLCIMSEFIEKKFKERRKKNVCRYKIK